MKFSPFYIFIIFSVLFSDAFLIEYSSEDYIDIDFNLVNHKVGKIDDLERNIVGKSKKDSNQDNQKISTFIRLDSNLSYNINFDIKSEKNGHTYFSEVEMKNQWNPQIPPTKIANWNPKWKEIRIPHRKIKLINKFRELTENHIHLGFFNFYVIRSDCEYAWRIKDYQMTQECIKEIWLGNAGRKRDRKKGRISTENWIPC